MQQVYEAFNRAVHAKLKEASNMFGVQLSAANVIIENNIVGRCAGTATDLGQNYFKLRFNAEAIEKFNTEMTTDTIPHEVAHLVCFINPRLGVDHDAGWKRVCRQLGGDDSRTHDMLLTPRHIKEIIRFKYITAGFSYLVGPKHHKQIQNGVTSISIKHPKHGRMVIQAWMWQDDAVKLDRTAKAYVPAEQTGSKKDRALAIWDANPKLSRADMIKKFVAEADMTKAGAATYYQNFKSGKM